MSIIDLSNIKRENADFLRSEQFIDHFFTSSLDPKELGENFRVIMDKAREFGNAEEVETLYKDIYHQRKANGKWGLTLPELWEAPKPLQEIENMSVPLPKCLPKVLQDYLTATAEYVQVYPEMCIIPMLTALSLCVQDKATIRHSKTAHTETLNLYGVTVAPPSERKSAVIERFRKDIVDYTVKFNEINADEINLSLTEFRSLKSEYERLLKNGKNPERLKELALEIEHFDLKKPMQLLVDDTTPEALIYELSQHNESMGIITPEGGVFDVISGMYSKGKSNIDIFLKAYSGEPYNVTRRLNGNTFLKKPLLTMSVMLQPDMLTGLLNNSQFVGRGLLARFLFAFPKEKQGRQTYISKNIPFDVSDRYGKLIYKLLNLPKSTSPIESDNKADLLFKDYFDSIQIRERKGKEFEYMKEWAGKQFGRCLKIAGILHLCEHDITDKLDQETAYRAIQLSIWFENQAKQAFNSFVQARADDLTMYVLERIKESNKLTLSKRDILRKCRKLHKVKELQEPLEELENKNYIKTIEEEKSKRGRPSINYNINPLIN